MSVTLIDETVTRAIEVSNKLKTNQTSIEEIPMSEKLDLIHNIRKISNDPNCIDIIPYSILIEINILLSTFLNDEITLGSYRKFIVENFNSEKKHLP